MNYRIHYDIRKLPTGGIHEVFRPYKKHPETNTPYVTSVYFLVPGGRGVTSHRMDLFTRRELRRTNGPLVILYYLECVLPGVPCEK